MITQEGPNHRQVLQKNMISALQIALINAGGSVFYYLSIVVKLENPELILQTSQRNLVYFKRYYIFNFVTT